MDTVKNPYGAPAERMIQIGVVAYALVDPAEAVIYLKAVFQGLQVRHLVRPNLRDEFDALTAAIRARVVSDFSHWLDNHDVPEPEWRRALILIEDTAQRRFPQMASQIQMRSTPLETAEAAIDLVYAADPLAKDIIARDIGMALRRKALRSAQVYAHALTALPLNLQN